MLATFEAGSSVDTPAKGGEVESRESRDDEPQDCEASHRAFLSVSGLCTSIWYSGLGQVEDYLD
jgi:hypothetical protein